MLKNSRLLTVTVPKATYTRIRSEAKKRNTTISGLVRDAFETYTQHPSAFEVSIKNTVRDEIIQLKTLLIPFVSKEEQYDIEKNHGSPRKKIAKRTSIAF